VVNRLQTRCFGYEKGLVSRKNNCTVKKDSRLFVVKKRSTAETLVAMSRKGNRYRQSAITFAIMRMKVG
jgi:hypothetical protein